MRVNRRMHMHSAHAARCEHRMLLLQASDPHGWFAAVDVDGDGRLRCAVCAAVG